MPKRKTRGCDLDTKRVKDLFSKCIPLTACKPKELFKLSKVTEAGVTSDWKGIVNNMGLIDELTTESSGRIFSIGLTL